MVFMDWIPTTHAAEMLHERGVLPAWVSEALACPDSMEPDRQDPALKHTLRRIQAHGNRVLRVVFDPASLPIRVVTVFFDRKASRGKP